MKRPHEPGRLPQLADGVRHEHHHHDQHRVAATFHRLRPAAEIASVIPLIANISAQRVRQPDEFAATVHARQRLSASCGNRNADRLASRGALEVLRAPCSPARNRRRSPARTACREEARGRSSAARRRSTRKCARMSRFRGTGCDMSSSIVPRSSLAGHGARRRGPTAQTTHSISTIGWSMPIARKSLGRSKFRSPQPSTRLRHLPRPLNNTSSNDFWSPTIGATRVEDTGAISDVTRCAILTQNAANDEQHARTRRCSAGRTSRSSLRTRMNVIGLLTPW